MRIAIDPDDDGCFQKYLLYVSIFWKLWNRGYIPIKEFSRCQEIYIIFNFYFNPSILLNICKILCQQGPQFSYFLLRIVFLFWILYVLTPNNNTLCPLLLDCGKQQLIISFSVSLHIVWFLRIDCTLMVPVICLRSQEFSVSFLSPCTAVIPVSWWSCHSALGPFLAQNEKSSSQEAGWRCTIAAHSALMGFLFSSGKCPHRLHILFCWIMNDFLFSKSVVSPVMTPL